MSAIFKHIKRIKVNDVEGKIGNCFIYNLSYSQGFSASPSKLTLALVSESPTTTALPEISLQTEYQVKIDDQIIFNGYIMSKEVDESGAKKTARVTLIDKSVRLDQYGVGLIKRHGGSAGSQSKALNITINCTNCINPNQIVEKHKTIVRPVEAGPTWSNNVICIGEEEIGETSADIMNVNYNAGHFSKACQAFYERTGLAISNPPAISYKRNYTGSFRDVLNSICSDAAVTFYYDPTSNEGEGAIVFVSLDSDIIIPSSKIESLKNQTDDNGGAIVIKSIKNKQTYEGTYSNHHSARFERAGKTKKINYTSHKPIINSHYSTEGSRTDVEHGMLARANSDLALLRYYLTYRDVGVFGANFSTSLINGGGWVQGDPNWQPEATMITATSNATNAEFEIVERVDYPSWWKVAEALGIDPPEMRNYLTSKPALQHGAYVYAIALDDTLTNAYLKNWELATKDGWQWYEAEYSPDDVERMYQQHGCNISKATQSPEPTRTVGGFAGFLSKGWFFQGNTEFWSNSVDISSDMAYLNPMTTAITDEVRVKQGISEKYTHLLWIPINEIQSMIGNIVAGDRQHPHPCPFAPYVETYSRAEKKPCYPDEDVTVENACLDVNRNSFGFDMCNSQPWKEGIVCNVQTYGVECNVGGVNVISEGPWYSDVGYRSNISTEVNFGSYRPKEYSISSCGGAGENFLNLKVSDTDVSADAYDPSENTEVWVRPDDPALQAGELISNALKSSCGSHTRPLNSWSVNFVGFPDNMATILHPVGIGTYNVNFGEGGISVDIEFADRPKESPTMDYFNSKVWHQKRYNT